MAHKHQMMLSDLYGRIGQMLAEHGDAPIGRVVMPMFPDHQHRMAGRLLIRKESWLTYE